MRSAFLAACLALSGCAQLAEQLQPGIDGVIGEAVEAARATAPRQKAALVRAQEDFVADPGSVQRVRLAALLATLPEPLHDDARALELLEPLVETPSPAGRLAAFLTTQITERQRLVREIERLTRERAGLERELQNAEKERQNLEKERDKREEALRQQLEALRAIERGILEREERLRKKPGVKR